MRASPKTDKLRLIFTAYVQKTTTKRLDIDLIIPHSISRDIVGRIHKSLTQPIQTQIDRMTE